jgi:IS5 family transposase
VERLIKGGGEMLGKKDPQGRFFDHYVYERHLPSDHELVRIHREVDFSFVEEETRDLYEEVMGRPSWPPEILFRMLFLEFYSNLSDVQVAEQCLYNLLYRWFVGLKVGEGTPDDTTLVVFRKRLGQGRVERFFNKINEQAKSKGLLVGRHKMMDATHVIANVAIPSTVGLLRQAREKVLREIEKRYPVCAKRLEETYGKGDQQGRRATEEELVKEVELTREFFSEAKGKYTEGTDKVIEQMEGLLYGEEKIASLVDPEARWGYQDEDHPFCGYKAHVGCDESEIVTSLDLLSGNENEGAEKNVRSLLKKEREQGMEHEAVVADALYDSAENRKAIHEEKTAEEELVKAYIPSRHKEKKLDRFRYVKGKDQVICPARQVSIGKSPHEQGHLYYFSVESCRDCPYREDCPPLNEGRVRVFVSEDHELKLLDENPERKEALKKRPLIERRFGGAKKWHGLGRARYWGKAKVAIQALMTFLVMNVKRIVKLLEIKVQKGGILQTG